MKPIKIEKLKRSAFLLYTLLIMFLEEEFMKHKLSQPNFKPKNLSTYLFHKKIAYVKMERQNQLVGELNK